MTIQLLKLYLELSHLSMHKQLAYTKKWVFFEKMMNTYFKAVILSIKTYKNTLKFNFLMEDLDISTV